VWAASSSGVGLAPRTGEANGDGSLWGLHGRMWPLLRCRRRLENKPLAPGQRHDIEDHAAGREKERHRETGRLLCAFNQFVKRDEDLKKYDSRIIIETQELKVILVNLFVLNSTICTELATRNVRTNDLVVLN